MSQPIIEVQNLSKRYRLGEFGATSLREEAELLWQRLRRGSPSAAAPPASPAEFWALRDVSFHVRQGEVLGIIGPNGAGKSTLLKILSRITEPTAGEVDLRGRVASLLEVGTGFHPELSGRENIYLNGAILGMKTHEIAQRLDEIVAFAEVEKFLDTPVKRYSSGMYVRLAFAVAAHLEPEILIVDEVLAVGDYAFQKKCLGRMKDFSSHQGRTILFVSHNLDAIATLCTHCLTLKTGRVTYYGDTASAIRAYTEQLESRAQRWQGEAGDKYLTLTETWAVSRSPSGAMDCGAPVEIGLRFTLHRPIEGLIVGYTLYSEYGYELIYSLYDDSMARESLSTAGEFTVRFIIPENILAAGSYRVVFDLGIHMVQRIIDTPHGDLAFSVENLTGPGRKYFANRARGRTSLFRPDWPVETEVHRRSL